VILPKSPSLLGFSATNHIQIALWLQINRDLSSDGVGAWIHHTRSRRNQRIASCSRRLSSLGCPVRYNTWVWTLAACLNQARNRSVWSTKWVRRFFAYSSF